MKWAALGGNINRFIICFERSLYRLNLRYNLQYPLHLFSSWGVALLLQTFAFALQVQFCKSNEHNLKISCKGPLT